MSMIVDVDDEFSLPEIETEAELARYLAASEQLKNECL